ncbi:MAG: (d)CMP kinase [Planctomycetota bacterium]
MVADSAQTAATMILTIDGPAAAGKSSVARALARELGLTFLDTGAMYRAVTWAALARGVDPADAAGCGRVARAIVLTFDADGRIWIDGFPGEPEIRGPEVTRSVSVVAAWPEVRRVIVPLQRTEAARRGGLVAEGRDMGTVVFPQAEHKFFLVASAPVRARRRAAELGMPQRFGEILADIERRDHLDETRVDSPLVRAADATLIDTDSLDVPGVVARMLAIVRKR